MDPLIAPRVLRAVSDAPALEARRLLRRLRCQLACAEGLVPLLDDRGEGRRILDEAKGLANGFDGGLGELADLVTRVERVLAPLGEAAKRYTVLCVGHGHIDMNWMWSWQETVSATHDTFASVLSFMDQVPEFTYSQSQASVYALMERYHPAMFEAIRQRVREGRWEITACHWVEGDKNLASGESLAHHMLYTRKYFQERFGLGPEDLPVDWEPDTFGHADSIPNVLAQGGAKYYYSCRTGGGHGHLRTGEPRPPVFWWQGTDGSRVLVHHETTWYNSDVNIGDDVSAPLFAFASATGLSTWLNVYGVGNHGGGPTRAEIERYIEMRDWPIYPNVRFGTSKEYFEAIEAQIASGVEVPTVQGELNYEFTGCYTSQSAIKRANRFGENFMVEAQTLTALAHRTKGGPHRGDLLREGWLNVLFNQFHDILPGSGIAATREHAMGLYQETAAIAGSAKREATKTLASRVNTARLLPDTPEGRAERAAIVNTPFVAGAGMGARETGFSNASGGGKRFRPYVVFNPCAWTRSEPVTVHLYDTDFDPSLIVARDEEGVEHPTMFLGREHDWGHDKLTVLFLAADVPPMGYKTFLLCEGKAAPVAEPVVRLDDVTVQTPHLRVQFNRAYGSVALIETAEGMLGNGGFMPAIGLVAHTEAPRGMTAWVLGDRLGPDDEPVAESFHIAAGPRNQGTSAPLGTPQVATLAEARLRLPGGSSTMRTRTWVHGLGRRLDGEIEMDWREIGDQERGIPGLSLAIHADVNDLDPESEAVYETPYGVIERAMPDDHEYPQDVPSLRFATFRAGRLWVTLVQDSKYGHRRTSGDLRLRLVRSSFDPDHAPEVGISKVRYSVYLDEHKPDHAELVRRGAGHNHPFLVFPTDLREGDEPTTRSFVSVSGESVVLAHLKLAEEGGGLLVRLVNYGDEPSCATLEFDPAVVEGLTRFVATDLMERPTGDFQPMSGSGLRATVPGRSFVSLRLEP